MSKIIIKTKLIEIDKKLYVELRSYELNKTELKVIYCKNKNYKGCYHIGEEYLILTLIMQKKGQVINTQRSMFPPYGTYLLVRFPWKPKGEVENKVVSDKEPIFEGDTAILP